MSQIAVLSEDLAFPVLTALVLSLFRPPPARLVPVVLARMFPQVQVQHFFSVTAGHLMKVLSQHSVLVARMIDRCFGLEHLAPFIL